jgi:hypothetical protein
MLFHEIAPFANGHREALETMRDKIQKELAAQTGDTITLSREVLEMFDVSLKDSSHAVYRFRQCAIDEWKTKENLETQVRTCRRVHR